MWVFCTGWLFGLPDQMPNFSKLESQLNVYLTKRTKKIIISHSFKQIFLLLSGVAIVGFHLMSLKFKLQTIDPTEILLS